MLGRRAASPTHSLGVAHEIAQARCHRLHPGSDACGGGIKNKDDAAKALNSLATASSGVQASSATGKLTSGLKLSTLASKLDINQTTTVQGKSGWPT